MLRKCPFCKSGKGFITTTYIGGYQIDTYDFLGNLLDSDRLGADDTEKQVECTECGKHFPIENVKIKGI